MRQGTTEPVLIVALAVFLGAAVWLAVWDHGEHSNPFGPGVWIASGVMLLAFLAPLVAAAWKGRRHGGGKNREQEE